MSIGTRIRYYRKLNKMTMVELASELGMSLGAIQKYENGTVELTVSKVEGLAKVFNIAPSKLVGWGEERASIQCDESKLKQYEVTHEVHQEVLNTVWAEDEADAELKAEELVRKEFPGWFCYEVDTREIVNNVDVNGHGE